jgi:group I intron endonuclease
MPDYQNGKIYKLVNNVDDKIYIGSTCDSLSKRKGKHKAKYNSNPDYPIYKHLHTIGWECVEIILIEVYPCINKDELLRQERKWIEDLKPELNKQTPARTRKEISKAYGEKNKEAINQKYQTNKEAICKERREKYVYTEAMRARRKAYGEKNKEAIKTKKAITTVCECGITHTVCHKTRHEKSKRHIDIMNLKQ